ncbi:hypothetical protein D0861_08431 [Hortaea werneckii]|uniref:Altered inheritance of mitochondria protein 9, mitochondrial n=1 Tax=Hortaea werneckii TaxID=91943 RepID=A0A3M7EX87_HORWE|nr:hypothetical protein D0861_08431 [Hortaea werneckii]
MVKHAEGGFNKVFRLSMDNGAVLIARIPTPIVGPISRVLASEVATIDFVRNVLDIPVPKVIAWDGETANAAGCELILMEEARGKQLGVIWAEMELDEKFKIVEEVVAVQKKLQSVTFSRYGSLHYKSDHKSDAAGYSASIDIRGSLPLSAKTQPVLNRGTLFHWDLRAPNFFIEDGHITSLIDWQDAWIAPLFMQERRPQLLEDDGEMVLRLPDYFETMEDKAEKAKVQAQVEKSILSWYYHRVVRERFPALQDLFDLPLTRIRRETVLFASDIWEGETLPLRACLYQLQMQWDKLNTGIPCPIHFSSQEIEAHEQASTDWNEKAEFWASLSGFVSPDGYTSHGDYEDARKLFKELREKGLQIFSGKELADFVDQSKWMEQLR